MSVVLTYTSDLIIYYVRALRDALKKSFIDKPQQNSKYQKRNCESKLVNSTAYLHYILQHSSLISFYACCFELKIAYEISLRISCFPMNPTYTAIISTSTQFFRPFFCLLS